MKKSILLLLLNFCLAACVLNIPTVDNVQPNANNNAVNLTTVKSIAYKADFENGVVGDWTGRGTAAVSVSDANPHGGKYCLYTKNRSYDWNGPQIDLTGKIFNTGIYKISVWVKIKEGEPDSEMIITAQRDKGGASSWDRITSDKIKSNTWVNLSGNYELKNQFDKVSIYVESPNAKLTYYIDDLSVGVLKEPQGGASQTTVKTEVNKNIPSLWEVYKDYFPIGTCVELNQFQGMEGELLLKHFSSLTAENIMKPAYISPEENTYNFEKADQLVDFAIKNKKLIRGHTLVWHSQNAKWMFSDSNDKKVSRDVLLKRMEDYIKTVVSRYKGKIYAWDVVNEVIDDGGNGLRNSEWLQIIGEDFIEKAFIYARQADSEAKLFINDFNTTDRKKGEVLYNVVKRLKEKKIPVDGVGMQFHITLEQPTIDAMAESLQKFSDLGVQIHITELDMSMNQDPKFTPDRLPEEMAIQQGHRYKEIFELFKKFKSITNVTFWGMYDGHTWLHGFPIKKDDWPLPFDESFKEKYAYWGLVDPAKLPKNIAIVKKGNDFAAAAKKGTPVIDGKEDDVWKTASVNNISIYVSGTGAKGTGKVLWDEKALYVFAKVQDRKLSRASPNAYEQDSIEIFVDEKNNKSIDYADDDAQYRINYENEVSKAGFAVEIKSAAVVTSDGYNIEVMIPFKTIKGAAGTKIGFDLQINDDSTGTGIRDTITKWNDPTNESFRNTSGWGNLVLSE